MMRVGVAHDSVGRSDSLLKRSRKSLHPHLSLANRLNRKSVLVPANTCLHARENSYRRHPVVAGVHDLLSCPLLSMDLDDLE